MSRWPRDAEHLGCAAGGGRSAGAGLWVLLLGTAAAHAQPPGSFAKDAEPSATGEATTTDPEPSEPSEEAARAQARALFEEGMRRLEAEDWEGAVEAFEASYELRPNANVLYNLANGQRLLFDYPAAIASFRRYLAMEGDRVSAERRAEIDRFLEEMLSKVAIVTVSAPEGATVAVDGRIVGTAPLSATLLVTAEEHVVTAEMEGCTPAVRRLRPRRGELVQVALTPQRLQAGGAAAATAPATTAGSGESPTPAPASTTTPSSEEWGRVPLGLGVATNLRAMDFAERAFLDNFGWSLHGGFQFTESFAAVLELSFPAVDAGFWARFAFLRLDWFSLAAAPGFVLTSGALDDRGVGFTACLELLAEFRLWRGLTVFLAPAAGLDALRATWVVPLALGVAYYV